MHNIIVVVLIWCLVPIPVIVAAFRHTKLQWALAAASLAALLTATTVPPLSAVIWFAAFVYAAGSKPEPRKVGTKPREIQ